MQNIIKLSGKQRTGIGKKATKIIRKEGLIPAIIYGLKHDAIPLSIDYSEAERILKSELGRNTILEITLNDNKLTGIIKEIQWDYLGDEIIHMDFLRINLKEKVIIDIPIKVTGEPIGIRLEDGILDFINRKVEVSCLPEDIVKNIEIDISELHIGQSIKAGTLVLDEKLELLSDHDTVICAVTGKEEEEEEVVEEEEEEVIEGEEGKEGEETKEDAEKKKKPESEEPKTDKEDSKK